MVHLYVYLLLHVLWYTTHIIYHLSATRSNTFVNNISVLVFCLFALALCVAAVVNLIIMMVLSVTVTVTSNFLIV